MVLWGSPSVVLAVSALSWGPLFGPGVSGVSAALSRVRPGCSEREDASAAFVTRGEGWWGGGAMMLVSLWSR